MHAVRNGEIGSYVQRAGGADNILHFGSRNTPKLKFEIGFGPNRYEIELTASAGDELLPTKELAWFFAERYSRWTKRELPFVGKEAGISVPNPKESIVKHVREKLSQWRVYHFHDTSSNSPMKKIVDVSDNRYLRSDASNLAAFLYFLREEFYEEYKMIRNIVKMVAPFFEDFVLEPLAFNKDALRLEWKHTTSDAYFNADSLSDGTLRFIAIATLLLQPRYLRPSVILIDEPELGLHPYAITILAHLVKRVAAERTQVIISTQSPLLLDHFEPQEVIVAERHDGSTMLKRLDVDSLATWLEEYSLGQLWEKNELGGRPTTEG